ncbi:regulator of chromosome condensation 1/beta-lactamase-inhibitor protein II [Suillus discolor]|uniref:Regulator of chromosome condensation 1/beta-lactamase-inhibitor protein II n=1 Tax=Suillus discolor TaxID=1912936 RepID=A0A9P7JQJ4_9AGAM|nr:regulator of chromosome condensation 1/beta-lactamase-inhibitor protein II [Suillus discolor]KAG2098284.1 regulator of chromosome condensation 1/beta-lactamase-inhibitor protein II [Suillus discolor]
MAKTSTSADTQDPNWGRVLICGGTDWPKLGRKERGGKGEGNPDAPDLLEPHILRSLSNIKIASIHASCSGCHFILLDVDGAAWMFGRNASSALGVSGEDVISISEDTPRRVLPTDLGAEEGTRFVQAACGRSHSLLVGDNGQVWSAGANNLGQCGHPVAAQIPTFEAIEGPFLDGESERLHVIKAAVGITFSIILTDDGKVFSFGSGEKGQLGNGRTGEHIITGNKTAFDIETEPVPVKGLDDKTIIDIACGPQHSVALDSQGLVYVWGYNGYCRLGLGNQQDVLIPKVVPNFAGPNEITMGAHIIAGPSNTVVLDKQQLYWMAGKWKNSGEGSSGSPYSSFRFIQDLMGCKISGGSCGGVTHFALTADDDGGVMTVAWGQNASYGELGLGPDEPKSATKPTSHQPLAGIEVISVAAGQHTTLFLAKPNAKFSDLPRHPLEVDAPELCIVCDKDNGDDDPALECDKCDHPYHLGCLDPPLEAIPEGEWFCPKCVGELGALSGHDSKSSGKKGTKSSPETKGGTKRKATSSTKEGALKRKK